MLQVINKFNLTTPSMDQLKYYYFCHFGKELPLKQYMSLYDNWQASNHKGADSQPGMSAEPCSSLAETPSAGFLSFTALLDTCKTGVLAQKNVMFFLSTQGQIM